MTCTMCGAMMHASCVDPSCDCLLSGHNPTSSPTVLNVRESDSHDEEEVERTNVQDERASISGGSMGRSVPRRQKRDAHLKDQQSTGRKRAAKQYPFIEGGNCEWLGYSNNGGGTSPILGCLSGAQQARHHGPDKSTSNNELGNVHRICHACHNRWHAANNEDYDWNETRVNKHDPRPMTDEERMEAAMIDLAYKAKKVKVIRD